MEKFEIKEIKNKKIWEDFLFKIKEKTFLQSFNWGEFNKLMGNKIWRLGIYEKIPNTKCQMSNLIGVALVIKIEAKRGNFLLLAHGPNINSKVKTLKSKVLEALLKELKKIAKKEGCSFIRMVPLWEKNIENQKLLQEFGFREAQMHASAYEATLKLDVSLPEKELLMGFRKTTRYLIRQALKNPDLKIIKSNKIEDIKIYDKLNQKVARYQKFFPFSFEFLKNEFDVFRKENQALLFFGKYKDKIIAAAFLIFWSKIAFYHQAALLPEYRKIPISYLILWEAIKEAKKRNCQFFDFWGYIDPKKNPKHPWAGPTLFKMGFGGKKREYLKTQDLPLSKKYWLTWIFEKIRKIKRRL
jgi:lipid II:glycine glycyltransferase (peptidoglycan interpeptide bridge formation enzyme)